MSEKKSKNYINMAQDMTKHYHELKLEIAELKEEQQAFIEVSQLPCKDCKLNELKEVLQKTLKRLADVGISGFIDEELLERLDFKKEHWTDKSKIIQTLIKDSRGEKEGGCEIADIKGKLQQFPADSKLPEQKWHKGSSTNIKDLPYRADTILYPKEKSEKLGAKESKGEHTVPKIRSHPEVNVAIQPDSKPTEMCFEYLDGSGKPVKYDGLVQKSEFVKDLEKLKDYIERAKTTLSTDNIKMIRFEFIEILIKKYT